MNAYTKLTATFLFCASAACSTSMSDPGVDPIAPGPGGPDAQALEIAGDYTVRSSFELSAAHLGSGGDFIIDFEELAEDPVEAISEMIADEIGLSWVAGQIEGTLRNAMNDDAQALADAVSDFLSVSLEFDVVSQLRISGTGTNLTMTHNPRSMEASLDADSFEYAFAELSADSLESYAVTVRGGNTLDFTQHQFSIPYGPMLVTILDEVLVPEIDPNANNLGDALSSVVNCTSVGNDIAAQIDLFGMDGGDWANVCELAVDGLAHELVNKISEAQLSFSVSLAGSASAADTSGDGRVDRLDGSWTSQFGTAANNETSPFRAERVR